MHYWGILGCQDFDFDVIIVDNIVYHSGIEAGEAIGHCYR